MNQSTESADWGNRQTFYRPLELVAIDAEIKVLFDTGERSFSVFSRTAVRDTLFTQRCRFFAFLMEDSYSSTVIVHNMI